MSNLHQWKACMMMKLTMWPVSVGGLKTINDLREDQVKLVQHVHRYLNDAGHRGNIFAWNAHNMPDGIDYSTIKQQARVTIRKFIMKAIVTCIEDYRSKMDDFIDKLTELSLTITEEEAKIERFFKDIKSNNELERYTTTNVPTKENNETDLSKKQIATLLLTSPLWVPLGVAGMVTVVPVTVALHLGLETYKLSSYKDNSTKYLERWTQKILQQYDLEELKCIIFDKLFGRMDEKMRNFSKSINKYKNTLKNMDRKSQTEAVLCSYTKMRALCYLLDSTLPKSQSR